MVRMVQMVDYLVNPRIEKKNNEILDLLRLDLPILANDRSIFKSIKEKFKLLQTTCYSDKPVEADEDSPTLVKHKSIIEIISGFFGEKRKEVQESQIWLNLQGVQADVAEYARGNRESFFDPAFKPDGPFEKVKLRKLAN